MPLKSNVFLRRAEREDLDTIVAWMDDPDFLHFLYGDRARSQKQIREQIVSMLGRTIGNTMPGGVYFVIDSRELGPIGLVSLQNISWRNRCCNLDLYIGAKGLRSGIVASVATYRALEYCFDELNLHRLTIYVYSFNTASWRLVERTGAKREVVMRDHVPRDGKLHDLYGYGLLRREFDALREEAERRLKGVSLADMIREEQQAAAAAETSA